MVCKYIVQIALELLEVANCISPGISRLRGVILYELQATLAAYARRKFSAGEISSEHMRNIMKVPANMSINSIETNV